VDLPSLMKRFIDATRDSTMCPPEKAATLGSLVLSLRPTTVVEIGVWMGSSFLPMAIAMKAYARPGDVCVAIDPWNADDSIEDQRNPRNVAWWASVPHDQAYNTFCKRISELEVASIVDVQRCRSDKASIPHSIDILHIDGNHGDPAIRDVDRFCPHVRVGGIVIMDDIGWEKTERITTAVELAITALPDLGFVKLYDLGTGAVFQRLSTNPVGTGQVIA
jgi:predicted O-methyltransferase YrrM